MLTSDELDALIAEARQYVADRAIGWAMAERLVTALSALRDTNPDEWEYGWESFGVNQVAAPSREFAERICEGSETHKVIRRRPAGPWLPVPSSPEGSK